VSKKILEYINAYTTAKSENEKGLLIEEIRELFSNQYEYLLQYGPKSNWRIQAEILIALGYPCVKPILSRAFEWLQDLNWPGAREIRNELLCKVDKTELVYSFGEALQKAFKIGDSEWLYGLSLFAEDVHFTKDDFTDKDNTYDILLYYGSVYEDGELRNDYKDKSFELLYAWGFPRIEQFIHCILAELSHELPHSTYWNQYVKLLDLIPCEVRDKIVRKIL